MNEKTIIKILHKFRPRPSEIWQINTLKILNNLENDFADSYEYQYNAQQLSKFHKFPRLDFKLKFLVSIIIILLFIGISGGVVYAADSAVPGELLFPFDKAAEQIVRIFTFDSTKKALLEIDIMDERIEEFNKLSEKNNSKSKNISVSEIEKQQLKLQKSMEEMKSLISNNTIDTENKTEILDKLEDKILKSQELIILNQDDSKGESSNNNQTQDNINKNNNNLEELEKQQNTNVNNSDKNQTKIDKSQGNSENAKNNNSSQNDTK